MTLEKWILNFLAAIFLICLMAGCTSKKTVMTPPPVKEKKQVTLANDIPQKLCGTYYRTNIGDDIDSDDEFMKLNIQKSTISLQRIGEDSTEFKWLTVFHRKIDAQTYILNDGSRFIKVRVLKNHNLKVSQADFDNYEAALHDNKLLMYSLKIPSGNFGLNEFALFGKYYISESDNVKYYSFQDTPANTNLLRMNSDGITKSLQNYRLLAAKKEGYVIGNNGSDERTILVPLLDHKLQDKQAGEVFSLFEGSSYELEQELRRRVGLGPKEIPISEPPVSKKTAKTPKTFDFADDQDDDYYDTYDDFDLNNGD